MDYIINELGIILLLFLGFVFGNIFQILIQRAKTYTEEHEKMKRELREKKANV